MLLTQGQLTFQFLGAVSLAGSSIVHARLLSAKKAALMYPNLFEGAGYNLDRYLSYHEIYDPSFDDLVDLHHISHEGQ